MIVVHEQITSIDAFTEFDDIFEASESRLDINFFSQVPLVNTFEEKKQYYLSQIDSAFNGTWPMQGEGETPFFYKGVYDGITMEFCGGFIEQDGVTFRGHWYLTAPDINGSRNAIHTITAAGARKVFYEEHGLTGYKTLTYAGSSLYQWLNLRIADGSLVLFSDPIIEYSSARDLNLVTFHFKV